ncbi:MAG: hypothetical protein U1D66_06780 [Erythrobacter sp.]|nr:hypothetical protein [Erythrobacter sp.]
MTERTTLLQEVGDALRDNGLTAAITALIGGTIALLAAVTRRAFTNDAMLARLDRELGQERDRVDHQRAEDRKVDADRLERIETDIRAMRDLMFEAFQRGRTGRTD